MRTTPNKCLLSTFNGSVPPGMQLLELALSGGDKDSEGLCEIQYGPCGQCLMQLHTTAHMSRYDWLSNPIRPVVRADTSACLGLYVRLSFGLSNELSNDASSSIFVKCPFDSVQRLIMDNQSLIDVPNIHGYHSMLLETVHFVPHHAVECSGFVQMVYSWGCVKNRYNG